MLSAIDSSVNLAGEGETQTSSHFVPPLSSSRRPRTKPAISRRPTASCAAPRPTARASSCCRRSGASSGTARDLQAGAEPLDGPAVTWAREAARELGIDLVAGSVSERVEGQEKLRNTSLHIGPDGEIEATYRKVHMFDVEVDGTVYRESAHEEPGDEVVLSADRRRRRAGADRLLRRALPRALPDPRRSAARAS